MYVFVRTDLSHAQRAVQSAHAAVEIARLGHIPPCDPVPNLILIGIASEPELESIADHLPSLGIESIAFREPDLGGSLTAVATAPVSHALRRHFRNYKLL